MDDRAGMKKRTLFHRGVLSSLGYRDYRLLWSGSLLSNIGTWIQTAALLWFVQDITRSNTWVGAVNLANYLPVFLFVLYAGHLADRLDRKKLLIVSQAVIAVAVLVLAICVSLGWASMPVIIVIVVVMGAAFTAGFPAWQVILPDLVSEEDMLNALALSSAQFNLARVIGPALGGMIISFWHVATAFYIDAASFLFVIGALLLARTKTPPNPEPSPGVWLDMREGLHYIRRRKWMIWVLAALAVASFFGFSYMVLLPSFSREVLRKGPGAYGVLLAMSGLGAVIGAPLVTFLNRYLKEKTIIKLSLLGLGLALAALSFSRNYLSACLFSVAIGCTFLVMGSSVNTLLQARSDHYMRGRVISFYILMYVGMFPIGGQALGLIADLHSVPFALLVGGLACLGAALVLAFFPSLLRDSAIW